LGGSRMPAHFGASSPGRIYLIKLRWIVGTLCLVIVALSTLLIAVLRGAGHEPASVAADPQAAYAAPVTTLQVLAARQRIEVGTKLEPQMLTTIPVPPDQIPDGAMLERDRDNALGKYAKELISSGALLSLAALTSEWIPDELTIPAGMRLVTI